MKGAHFERKFSFITADKNYHILFWLPSIPINLGWSTFSKWALTTRKYTSDNTFLSIK